MYSPHISAQDGIPKVEDIVLAADDSEDTREKKRVFAKAWAKDPSEPEQAALAVWPHNIQWRIFVAQEWVKDPEILAYIGAVHEVVGVAGQLPDADEFALYIWKLAKIAKDEDIRMKYLRLFAESTGQLKRPGGEGDSLTVNQNRVMVTNHFGSDENWADSAHAQQKALQKELSEIADASVEEIHE